MVSGRKPDEARRRRVAALRKRGLSLAEIGRRLGTSKQLIHQILQAMDRARTRSVPCCACGQVILSQGALARDASTALCLPCLEQRPEAPFGQRLKAYRLAAGMTQTDLARKAGMSAPNVRAYEEHGRLPKEARLLRLIKILGQGLVAGLTRPSNGKADRPTGDASSGDSS